MAPIQSAPAGPALTPAASAGMRQRGRYGESRLLPYLFILPHLIFFGMFIGFATVLGFWISLHRFSFLRHDNPYIGLRNYDHLLRSPNDLYYQRFHDGMGNTLLFVLMSVPVLVILGLLLANLLNARFPGRTFFRALYLAPWSLSVVVIATLWQFIFRDPDEGLINLTLRTLHLSQNAFLADKWSATFAITTATVWWTVGFNIIVLLAALQNVPEILYEASQVDGAGPLQRFIHVTLPGIRPVLLFVIINQMLASFNQFGQSQIMTGGGPSESTTTIIQYIWQTGWSDDKMGMASAMSFLFAIILVTLSLFSFRLFSSERA